MTGEDSRPTYADHLFGRSSFDSSRIILDLRFLTQVPTATRMCAIRLLIVNAMPRARGRIRLNIGPPSTRASTTTRSLHVRRPAVLGVAQGALEHLLQHPRAAVRHEAEDVQGLVGVACRGSGRPAAAPCGADAGETVRGLVSHDRVPRIVSPVSDRPVSASVNRMSIAVS